MTAWSKSFWLGGTPDPQVNIDNNLAYLETTRFLPNYDTAITVPASAVASEYAHWTGRPHDLYDGAWDGGLWADRHGGGGGARRDRTLPAMVGHVALHRRLADAPDGARHGRPRRRLPPPIARGCRRQAAVARRRRRLLDRARPCRVDHRPQDLGGRGDRLRLYLHRGRRAAAELPGRRQSRLCRAAQPPPAVVVRRRPPAEPVLPAIPPDRRPVVSERDVSVGRVLGGALQWRRHRRRRRARPDRGRGRHQRPVARCRLGAAQPRRDRLRRPRRRPREGVLHLSGQRRAGPLGGQLRHRRDRV